MHYTVAQLAESIGGTLHGPGSAVVRAALPIEEATADSITFLTDRRFLNALGDCSAAAVIAPVAFGPQAIPTILVDDPLSAILDIAARCVPSAEKPAPGIDPRSAIDPSARLDADCHVGPFAVVEAGVVVGKRCRIHAHAVVRSGCRLGDDVEIHPQAVLYPRTVIGDRSIVHAGAVLGCDGFGYQQREGSHRKVPQLGNIEVGADVEIGSNTTIDRATLGSTRIGDGSKIDNQVMIAHNCKIGKHNIFVGQAGMAGSCTTGDYVVLAGQVGVADHVRIGERSVLAAHAGVFTDVPANEVYFGAPARPEREAKRLHLALDRVPEMRRNLAEVRRVLGLDRSTRTRKGNDNEPRKAAG